MQIFLVEAGHEDQGISKNSDGNTPLMEAVEVEQEDAAAYLAQMFTRCIDWKNQAGLDAVCFFSCLPPSLSPASQYRRAGF